MIFDIPIPGTLTYASRGIEIAVAELPSLGTRIRMMVSVLDATSSPARSESSSLCESGLPCASVRLSVPTIRMSTAPSLPPPRPSPPSQGRAQRVDLPKRVRTTAPGDPGDRSSAETEAARPPLAMRVGPADAAGSVAALGLKSGSGIRSWTRAALRSLVGHRLQVTGADARPRGTVDAACQTQPCD